MRLSRRSWLVIPLLASSVARADDLGRRYVEAARELLGTRYEFGGRMLQREAGTDCQGVLFYAAERVTGCGWKSWSVYPTRTEEHRELGAPVEGLAPVGSDQMDVSKLKLGDVLMLVGFMENPAERSIATLEGRPVWVWHTGVYSGDGRWIVGDHFAGRVVEVDLKAYLAEHPGYVGVFVTRMTTPPRPRRCRKHAPMKVAR